jgi:hypothetical protein
MCDIGVTLVKIGKSEFSLRYAEFPVKVCSLASLGVLVDTLSC